MQSSQIRFLWVSLIQILQSMGEYIDVGIQTPVFAYILLISSIAVGAVALLGFNAENDDDDSDSGSGGLMQPI